MCSRLRGHMPVYPKGSKVTLQLALIISYGPRDACCHCSLGLPEGRMWTSSLMQDFPLFLQTWSLYQLASTFENTVPWGLYGDPFSFITSRVLLFFFLNFDPLLHLDLTTNAPQGGTLLDFVWTSIPGRCLHVSHESPSYKNYLSFGHLCHRACVEGSRTLVRAGSTMWHPTQAITFGNKYGGCFQSEQSTESSLLLRWGLVCLGMASNSLWGWGWTISYYMMVMMSVCVNTLAMGCVRVCGSKNNSTQSVPCFHFHMDSRYLIQVSRLAW